MSTIDIRPHSEGFVVEFSPENKKKWVGNFGPGSGGINKVIEHPNGKHLIVISRGMGYIVDPETQSLKGELYNGIQYILLVPELQKIICGDFWKFIAFDFDNRTLWQTRMISIDDGFCCLQVTGKFLTGKALDIGDIWVPFAVDLTNGMVGRGIISELG